MKAKGLSYADIAQRFGLSRQRIQQIFSPKSKTMFAIADRAKALCEECGVFDQFGHYHHKVYEFDILNSVENILYLCNSCHLSKNGTKHYCKNCGKQVKSWLSYCSKGCAVAFHSVTHKCSNCQKVFTLNASQKVRIRASQSGLIFCSKRCQGTYVGDMG